MAARVPYVEPEQAADAVRAIYDRLASTAGRVLNFYKLVANHPASLGPFIGWYPTLRQGPLDARLRELAYVRASQVNHCGY
jgi:alkylhydroperoxidase family enzyme